jgi:quinol monooxygenase YgiN
MVRQVPVLVLAFFTLVPDRQRAALEVWKEMACLARGRPACRSARVVVDRGDSTDGIMLSEWSDVPAFDRFVREVRLIWLIEALGCAHCSVAFRIFESVPSEGDLSTSVLAVGTADRRTTDH